jgi:redox-sensitive bicupin YhaK (pirin superfamily)
MSIRPVKRLVKAKPTLEGAGVHLRRAFGFGNTSDFDPFLLLDDFRNDVPEDYLAGFPWSLPERSSTATAWATVVPSLRAMCSG